MLNAVRQIGLDNEWIELLQEAKRIGITEEEVRSFFNEAQSEKNKSH